ncbi:MAG: PaaI family thioesterase [Parvularculaceae bacterium]
MPEPLMNANEIGKFMREHFARWDRMGVTIEDAAFRRVKLRMSIGERQLRAGGTVAGPAMFALADTAMYIAVLASVGPKAQAVTTNMSINFLKRPPMRDLIAECQLLKLGRRLAVGDVIIYSDDDEEPVAHATGTYAIPVNG